MRAWCPHCGALNEFARPPTTAIVYCQHCRKPFGAAALSVGTQTPKPSIPRRQSTPNPERLPPQRAVSDPEVPTSGKNRVLPGASGEVPGAYTRDPASPVRSSWSGTAGDGSPVATQVIVPKGRPTDAAEGPLAKVIYSSPDGLETDFVLDDENTVGRRHA